MKRSNTYRNNRETKNKGLRSSNIELLRIFAVFGVIVLHYNNNDIGKAFSYASANEINLVALYLIESLAIVGVNIFILISGYFLSTRNDRTLWQPIKLIVQVVLIKLAFTIASQLLNNNLNVKALIGSLIPNNYYVVLYCTLYIISPYLNVIVDRLSDKGLRRLILILVLVFGAYPTLVDLFGALKGEPIIGLSSIGMYGSQWGYQIVNFGMMYIIGASIRRGVFDRIKSGIILICACSNVVFMTLWNIAAHFAQFERLGAWDYCNPLVIINATLIFLLFRRIKIDNVKASKIINHLAKGTFTVFLTHGYFLGFLHIEKYAVGNTFFLLLHIVISSIAIYLAGYAIYIVYDKIMAFVYKKPQNWNALFIPYNMTEEEL